MKDTKDNRIHRWMLAGIWTGLIYSTLYIMRPVCEFFKQYVWFSCAVNAGIVLFAIGIVLIFVRKKYIRKTSNYLLFLLVLLPE